MAEGARADPVVVRLRLPRGRPAAGDRDARGRPGRRTSPPAPGCRPTRSRSWPAAIGVPADALVATVERFNGFCETGVDEDFGRGEDEYDTFFAGGDGPQQGAHAAATRPPFYAARFVLSDLGTKGGLVTDAAGRVLREDGSAIAGLYASSNSAASVFGAVYPGPGAPLGSAMVFASLAVRAMLGPT